MFMYFDNQSSLISLIYSKKLALLYVTYKPFRLKVIMLNVVMLSVVMLSVMAPWPKMLIKHSIKT